MSFNSVAVVVMAKYPTPGKVKTRLSPAFSPEQSANVQLAFLCHVASRLHQLQPSELVICFDPPDAGHAMRKLLGKDDGLTFLPQTDGDLGQRLGGAFRCVSSLHRRVLFLGVDSPDVPEAHLHRAVELTGQKSVTLGPSDDGGYWCLGLTSAVDASALLEGINWSSGHEARQTLDRADALSYSTGIAPTWDDVDHPDDLNRLLERLRGSRDAHDQRLLDRLAFLPDGVSI